MYHFLLLCAVPAWEFRQLGGVNHDPFGAGRDHAFCRPALMRLLVLANIVPYPPDGGIHQRIYHLLKRIAAHHKVTLGCHSWGDDDLAGAEFLSAHGIRTITAPLLPWGWRNAGPALRDMVMAGIPPEIGQYQTQGLHALVASEQFDVLQVEETILAPYAKSLPRGSGARTVLTFHNVHFQQERRIAALEPTRGARLWRDLNARMMRRYEPALVRRFDRTIAVSEADRRLLGDAAPGVPMDVLPNGVDTSALQPLPDPAPGTAPAVIFVGTLNYRPCSDAVLWFVAEILPLLRADHPSLELWIVGKLPPPEVERLAGAQIHVTGRVDDVVPWYRHALVAVVPLRAGGGSRLKILEAMALGRPVVSTTIGAEGLDVTDGQDILLADEPAAFAAAVAGLIADPPRRQALAQAARRFVEDAHDWDAIADQQLRIYDELLAEPAG